MTRFLYIGLFGLLGVFARYFSDLAVSRWYVRHFFFATFLINMLGAFVIGVIYVLGVERALISNEMRLGLMVGFLGGFTTFSSYCLEAVRLFEQGHYSLSILYLGLCPVLGFFLAFTGMFLTRKMLGLF